VRDRIQETDILHEKERLLMEIPTQKEHCCSFPPSLVLSRNLLSNVDPSRNLWIGKER
jgi:hypothetical protein